MKVVSSVLGVVLAGGAAFGATNWIIGLGAGSSGAGQSANISNLAISAVASPSPTNLLYPGGSGDVVVTISNPNPFPVTITALQLPANTTYATGYTTSALTTTQAGCLASTPSDVIWNYANATSGSSHTLTSAVDRRRERRGQQPTRGDIHQRCQHDDGSPGRLRQHVLLHAVAHRSDCDRRIRHVHHDPGHRRLDELIASERSSDSRA